MTAKYPPYVNAYGNIPTLFEEISKASVPPKFTNNFLQTALGLKSTSYRAMIPLLKKLGFIDQGNVPTQSYRDFRDEAVSRGIMAERLRAAYTELFNANEFAYKLTKNELTSKLRTVTGAAADDKNIQYVAATFLELCKLADFENQTKRSIKNIEEVPIEEPDKVGQETENNRGHHAPKLGISYTINLNLPATTEIEVFNAIFKSLKEHIIGRD